MTTTLLRDLNTSSLAVLGDTGERVLKSLRGTPKTYANGTLVSRYCDRLNAEGMPCVVIQRGRLFYIKVECRQHG